MNGAPGRKVRAISAHARLMAPGVRISMKTFMLTAPSTDASGSGMVSSMRVKVTPSSSRDSAWPIMSWSWSTAYTCRAPSALRNLVLRPVPQPKSRKVLPVISPSSSATASKPIWYAATLEAVGGGSWSGDLYVAEGPSFATTPFKPSGVSQRKVGTMNWTAVFVETGQLFYSVDGVSVNKRLVRQLTRTDNFNGAFLGATHQQVVGCVNESLNRTIEMTGPIDIVQGSSTISVTAGGCVFSGRFSQAGQFGSLDGTYTCTGGDVGTGRVYEMLVGIHHVSARFDTISTGAPSCQSSGYLAGIRRQ